MNPQTPARLTGSASMSFQNPVYVVSCASVVGKKEGEGPLGSKFDLVCEEPMFGEATWEAAESTMQKEAAALALGKAGLTPGDIRMTFAGDLLAQTTASSFGIAGMGIPFYGLFGACSTIGESLSLGAMSVAAGYGEHILCATSSILPAQKKNSDFLWLTETSVLSQPRGRLPGAVPVFSPELCLFRKFRKRLIR